jgi:hypothetical protein
MTWDDERPPKRAAAVRAVAKAKAAVAGDAEPSDVDVDSSECASDVSEPGDGDDVTAALQRARTTSLGVGVTTRMAKRRGSRVHFPKASVTSKVAPKAHAAPHPGRRPLPLTAPQAPDHNPHRSLAAAAIRTGSGGADAAQHDWDVDVLSSERFRDEAAAFDGEMKSVKARELARTGLSMEAEVALVADVAGPRADGAIHEPHRLVAAGSCIATTTAAAQHGRHQHPQTVFAAPWPATAAPSGMHGGSDAPARSAPQAAPDGKPKVALHGDTVTATPEQAEHLMHDTFGFESDDDMDDIVRALQRRPAPLAQQRPAPPPVTWQPVWKRARHQY